MEKVELRHIQPYLPYKIKVQYEGILNGKEINDYKKNWQKEQSGLDLLDLSNSTYTEPKEITGLKIGYIKQVGYYKNWIKYMIGIKNNGLQVHYGTDKLKMILRPMSDLTKEELRAKGFDSHIDYLTHEQEDPMKAPYEMIEYLFSKHFDVFLLIDKGLAININDLK